MKFIKDTPPNRSSRSIKKQLVFLLLTAVALLLAACSQEANPAEPSPADPGEVTSQAASYVCPMGGSFKPFSDTWGAARDSGRTHEGTDIEAATGTPLVAVTDGKLVYTKTPRSGNPGSGQAVKVAGNDGKEYYYGHLSRYAFRVTEGKPVPVTKGQVIGYVGKTGTWISHLHFTIYEGGRAKNPYSKLVQWCAGGPTNPNVPLPKRNGKLQETRYKDGPCKGKGSSCKFDTRTFVTFDGKQTESISAYGQYWNYTDGKLVSDNLETVTGRYNKPNGPCYGKGKKCKFDTRTFTMRDGQLVESITAYGQYWNFVGIKPWKPAPYSRLHEVKRYADGPCKGKGKSCTFDTRTIIVRGGQEVESVTAYGKYWNFVAHGKLWKPAPKGNLHEVERYKAGPCKGKGKKCTFDSRTFVDVGGTQVESITAYGQYWNFY